MPVAAAPCATTDGVGSCAFVYLATWNWARPEVKEVTLIRKYVKPARKKSQAALTRSSRPFASSPRGTLEISGSLKSLTGRAHELPRSRFLREYARNLRGPPVGVPKCEVFGMGGCGQNAPFPHRRP